MVYRVASSLSHSVPLWVLVLLTVGNGLSAQNVSDLADQAQAQLDVHDPELSQTLWRLLDNGQAVETFDFALSALRRPAFDASDDEFLVLIAASLARQFYDPAVFLGSEAAQQLRELPQRSTSSGVRQLLAWHGGEGAASTPNGPNLWDVPSLDSVPLCSTVEWDELEMDDRRWSWWHSNEAPTEPLALSRQQAGRALIRTLGSWYGQRAGAGDLARAASYLCVAAVLDSSILISPFRDLIWSYLDAGQPQLVKELHREEAFRSHFHQTDPGYLRQIENVLNFHPWYANPWVVGPASVLVLGITACIAEFYICQNPGNTVSVVVQIP